MAPVGIRLLKNKLSAYLRRVKEGEVLAVTDRGKTIAYITPAKDQTEFEEVQSLILKGIGIWKGGKPKGVEHPIQIPGKPLSEYIREERR